MDYIGKEITGKQFNEIFKNNTFYKFTNNEEIHYGYQYVDGLNIDTNEFNINRGECSKGGLYFTSEKYIYEWIQGEYVRVVTIPDDARICIYKTKFKSNKIFVEPRIRIYDSDLLSDEQVQMLAVQQNVRAIRYIKEPSDQVQMLAVQHNGYAIKYIKEPSDQVQMLAVQQNGCSIRYIKEPSNQVQMLAVQHNGYAIQYIKEPSDQVQMLAVQQNGCAIRYIKKPSDQVQMLAVQKNGNAIQYIKDPSDQVQKLSQKNNTIRLFYF